MSQYVTTPDGKRHKFPDGATPEQIKSALSRYAAPMESVAPATMMTQEFNPISNQFAALRGRAVAALPTIGGLAGGLAGTPGGFPGMIAGAAAGGALGEGIRQRAAGQDISPRDIGIQGALQGGYEAVGGLAAKGAARLARPLMKGAITASRRLASSFPDMVETALKYKLPVTEAGGRAAVQLRDDSALALNMLLRNAKASGTRYDANKVARYARSLLGSKSIRDSDKAVMAREVNAFLTQHRRKIDPLLLKEIKQEYQALASPLYAKDMDLASAPVRRVARRIATGAREELERIPGVAAQEAKTKSFIGIERAIRERNLKPAPFATTWELQKPMTYPVARMLARPEFQSTLAIWLNDPRFKAALRHSPRAAAALMTQMMYSAEPDATLP